MKVTLIATVLNEEKTIKNFLQSVSRQTRIPDEVIIVDGGSTDGTPSIISSFQFPISNKQIRFTLLKKKGNRSVGRNEAIKHATNDIILCSDAGCTLEKSWVEKITEPFKDKTVDVVAGYYKGKTSSVFEKCLIPYVLVMPDKIDPSTFLPASRSMALRKSVWKRVGGFSEKLSHNEDYEFAKKLKESGAKIVFQKNAVVYWIPRKNVWEAFRMFFRFALGDGEAGIFRPKVGFIFARYTLGAYLLLLAYIMNSYVVVVFFITGILIYIFWSIGKNYKYVEEKLAILYLPLLQIVSDIAVMSGSLIGLLKHIRIQNLVRLVGNNKAVSIIIVAYIILMLFVINWGIPQANKVFTYQMDEWHQLQAVGGVFTQGSPNIEGAANGSMFHFFLSGLYLIPFFLFGVINPFAFTSAVDNLDMQQRLFQILRLNTLFFGVLSIIAISYIAKKYFNVNPLLTALLFTVNPIWLMLSNYFKYDIALIFWLLLSMIFFLRYATTPSLFNFLFASGIAALALSVKVSAIPLICILVISYILFTPKGQKTIKHLVYGIIVFITVFCLFGIPDLLLGKGNMQEYLYDNLVRAPERNEQFMLGTHYVVYLFTKEYPLLFGRFLYITFFMSIVFVVTMLLRNIFLSHKYDKLLLFILCCFFLFALSLVPLRIEARSNRMLVLLPFMVLTASIFLNYLLVYIKNRRRLFLIIVIGIGGCIQLFETLAWQSIKLYPDPREISSVWIRDNIPRGTIIGVENIPIYQRLPDVVTREYYQKQKEFSTKTEYDHVVINSTLFSLPQYVILTNDTIETNYLKNSPKQAVLRSLDEKGYERTVQFSPNFTFYRFIGNSLNFYFSNLIPSPVTITVYNNNRE